MLIIILFAERAGFRAKLVARTLMQPRANRGESCKERAFPEIFLRRLRASPDVEIQEDEEISERVSRVALFSTVGSTGHPRLDYSGPVVIESSIKCPRVSYVRRAVWNFISEIVFFSLGFCVPRNMKS